MVSCQVDAEDKAGIEELCEAVRRDELGEAKRWLQTGVDPNAALESGELPLDLVESPEMVAQLVAAGADPLRHGTKKAHSLRRHVPPHLSRQRSDHGSPRQRSIAEAFVAAGTPVGLSQAVHYGWIDRVRQILAEGLPQEELSGGPLFEAVDFGDDRLLALLLEAGVPTAERRPPRLDDYVANSTRLPDGIVEYAAQLGSTAQVLMLIEAGAPVLPEFEGWEGFPRGSQLPIDRSLTRDGDLLDLAIARGDLGFCRTLIASGLDPHQRKVRDNRSFKSSPALLSRLSRAAWLGHKDIVALLIDASPDGGRRLDLSEPLLAAACAGHEELYDNLRGRGPSRSAHGAAALGRKSEVLALMEDPDVDVFAKEPRCRAAPLAWAVLLGRTEVVEVLLGQGADPDGKLWDRLGYITWAAFDGTELPRFEAWGPNHDASLLRIAVRKQSWEIAERLVAAGAQVDPIALRALVVEPSAKVTELLRVAGDAGQVSMDGPDWAFDALQSLASRALPESEALARAEWLLELGASTSLVNAEGESVLQRGGIYPHQPGVLRALRDAGAPVPDIVGILQGWLDPPTQRSLLDAMDEHDIKGLLHRASSFPGTETTARILDGRLKLSGTMVVDQLHRRAYAGRVDLLDLLLARAPASYDEFADPKLLQNGARHPEFIRALLERGHAPSLPGTTSYSALHIAAGDKDPESVRLLLDAGASPDARDYGGRCPLSEVLRGGAFALRPEAESNALQCIRLLLERGADPLAIRTGGSMSFERLLYSARSPSFRNEIREVLRPYVREDWL